MLNVVQHLFLNANKKPNQTKTAFKNFQDGLLKQTISLQFFKGYFPQILLGPFLNTLSHMKMFFLHGST